MLGTVTMRDLGREIGDHVTVGVGGRSVDLRVVGRAVFPNLGDAAQLGRGAAMPISALEALDDQVTQNIVLVRFKDGRSAAVERAKLSRAIDPYPVFGPQRPDDLVSIGSVGGLVYGMGLCLVMLAALTLAHTLITSVRRRSMDLALLKALGFTRSQAGAVIGWQGLTLLAVATIIGLPVGVIAARAAWEVLAGELGVPSQPTVDPLALALIVPLVFGFGLLAAVVPALRAARTPTARMLPRGVRKPPRRCSAQRPAGSNSSTRLPDGSCRRICLPPGPSTMSLRKLTPASRRRATSVPMSSTMKWIRFQPPGAGCAPSGIGRPAELFGPARSSRRFPRFTSANAGAALVRSSKPSLSV